MAKERNKIVASFIYAIVITFFNQLFDLIFINIIFNFILVFLLFYVIITAFKIKPYKALLFGIWGEKEK